MKKERFPGLLATLCVAIMAVTVSCAEHRAATKTEPFGANGSTPQTIVEPANAKKILMRMATFLANTQQFTVNIQDSYDVFQESGQKIKFSDTRKLNISRPDGLRLEVEQSDGDKNLVLYDGKEITVFNASKNVYAQVSKSGGLDEAIAYFVKNLKMRLPLAMLLVKQLPMELERRTQSLDYVEQITINGHPAHHLAGRTDSVDYQVWIAEGEQPWPLRVVLTYKNAEGQPQFEAQLTDWNAAPENEPSLFTFTAPEGARKISFLAQVPQVSSQRDKIAAQTGEQQ
jgi:hypothetical protein